MEQVSALRDEPGFKTFLKQCLPRKARRSTEAVVQAVNSVAQRYERYRGSPSLGSSYAKRRRTITSARDGGIELWQCLCTLDPITRDSLTENFGEEWIEKLQGYLTELASFMNDMSDKNVQKAGKPRDLALEYWIGRMADIFRDYFLEDAKNSQSLFLVFIKKGAPAAMPAHGTLDRRHVSRVLARPANVL